MKLDLTGCKQTTRIDKVFLEGIKGCHLQIYTVFLLNLKYLFTVQRRIITSTEGLTRHVHRHQTSDQNNRDNTKVVVKQNYPLSEESAGLWGRERTFRFCFSLSWLFNVEEPVSGPGEQRNIPFLPCLSDPLML